METLNKDRMETMVNTSSIVQQLISARE